MDTEIEEQISDELKVVMFKFGQKLQRLEEKKNDELEKSETISKALGISLDMCFEIKKLINEIMLEIKTIQEKYSDDLKGEGNE